MLEDHVQAGAQHRLGAQHMLESRNAVLDRVKELGVRPEVHGGAGVALADLADHLQWRGFLAIGEGHLVLLTAATDQDFQAFGKPVGDRYTHPVQAAREGVVFVRELTAGMKPRHDDFDAGDLLAFVLIDRNAAAVVLHRHRAILI